MLPSNELSYSKNDKIMKFRATNGQFYRIEDRGNTEYHCAHAVSNNTIFYRRKVIFLLCSSPVQFHSMIYGTGRSIYLYDLLTNHLLKCLLLFVVHDFMSATRTFIRLASCLCSAVCICMAACGIEALSTFLIANIHTHNQQQLILIR